MRHGKAVTNGARQNESFPLPVQVTAADVARERSENSVRGPNRGWIVSQGRHDLHGHMKQLR
jgi:hypothetical protein